MLGKNFTITWIVEFERADELTAHLGVHTLIVLPEVFTEELTELQPEDPVISPLLDFLDRDVTPTRDDLRALPLDSRNLWSESLQSVSTMAYSSENFQSHSTCGAKCVAEKAI